MTELRDQRTAVYRFYDGEDRLLYAARKQLWEEVRAGHRLGMPPAYLAEKAGRARSTVYRHLEDGQTGEPDV